MDPLRWEERPSLRRPVLVAAFEGWNDAAEAASTAAGYLATSWEARPFAAIDPEEFYDFTAVRPQVHLVQGLYRRLDWPAPHLTASSPPGARHDVVFLRAAEPQLRWRAFADTVTGLARELNVELVVLLGALLADVPHTRPVQVTGTAANADLLGRLGLQPSRYEGPTGIVGVLHNAFTGADIPVTSLWASVPHYVGGTASPKAALALVRRTASLVGASVDAVELEVAASAYERQVSEVVAEDDEMAAYVRRLEDMGGDEEAMAWPSGDALAAEVERFLRGESQD